VGETNTTGLARLSAAEREVLTAYAARAAWPAGFAIYQRGATADGVFEPRNRRVEVTVR